MSLLTMCQGAALRLGINSPSTIVGNTDPNFLRMLGLANEEGEELVKRYPWQATVNEATFTTVATESQGTIASIIGSASATFDYIINETFWNRTLRRPVFGPVSDQNWEQMKAQSIAGPWNQYIIRNNTMYFIPVPTASQTCAFKWASKAFCESSGGTDQVAWAADTDVGLMDEALMRMGIVWRWKQSQGLEYAEDFNKYELQVADAMARDGTKARLNLHGTTMDVYPGIVVPSGSWVIT